MVKRRGEALCDTEEHVQKAREGSLNDLPLSLTKSGAGLLSHEYPPQYHRR